LLFLAPQITKTNYINGAIAKKFNKLTTINCHFWQFIVNDSLL